MRNGAVGESGLLGLLLGLAPDACDSLLPGEYALVSLGKGGGDGVCGILMLPLQLGVGLSELGIWN